MYSGSGMHNHNHGLKDVVPFTIMARRPSSLWHMDVTRRPGGRNAGTGTL